MRPGYESKTTEQALGHVVEEIGEVLEVIGKAQRWGLDSSNPLCVCGQLRNELVHTSAHPDSHDYAQQSPETNKAAILREFEDLRKAMEAARNFLLVVG
jgi:hypothetical protein